MSPKQRYFARSIAFSLTLFISCCCSGEIFAQTHESFTSDSSQLLVPFTTSEGANANGTQEPAIDTVEESSAYWAARESLPWEKMAILYTSQLSLPFYAYFTRYETGNTIFASTVAIAGAMLSLDGILMYNRPFVKKPVLFATLKLFGGISVLALAYYQFSVIGSSPPDSRFWNTYLAYQLFAIPIEIYAITVKY